MENESSLARRETINISNCLPLGDEAFEKMLTVFIVVIYVKLSLLPNEKWPLLHRKGGLPLLIPDVHIKTFGLPLLSALLLGLCNMPTVSFIHIENKLMSPVLHCCPKEFYAFYGIINTRGCKKMACGCTVTPFWEQRKNQCWVQIGRPQSKVLH